MHMATLTSILIVYSPIGVGVVDVSGSNMEIAIVKTATESMSIPIRSISDRHSKIINHAGNPGPRFGFGAKSEKYGNGIITTDNSRSYYKICYGPNNFVEYWAVTGGVRSACGDFISTTEMVKLI